MTTLIVVVNPQRWPLASPGITVVSGRAYLTDAGHGDQRGTRVFNLCRSYRYQTVGYCVSLLAEARGHKPLPDVGTIQALRSGSVVRVLPGDLDAIVQRALRPLASDRFALSVYFGQNMAGRYATLAQRLFAQFPVPLPRAVFVRTGGSEWLLQSVRPIAASDIPPAHHDFVISAATAYFGRRVRARRRLPATRFDLAILHDPEEAEPPSNNRALAFRTGRGQPRPGRGVHHP